MRFNTGNPYGQPLQVFANRKERWELAIYKSADGYENFKLYAVGGLVPHKANYWIGVEVAKARITESRYAVALRLERPRLHYQLIRYLRGRYGHPEANCSLV